MGHRREFWPKNERCVSGMKMATIFGILLIVIGLVVLVYGGVTYTSKQTTMQVGPVEVTAKEKRTLPLPSLGSLSSKGSGETGGSAGAGSIPAASTNASRCTGMHETALNHTY